MFNLKHSDVEQNTFENFFLLSTLNTPLRQSNLPTQGTNFWLSSPLVRAEKKNGVEGMFDLPESLPVLQKAKTQSLYKG